MNKNKKKKVIIIGAGFGGCIAAKKLANAGFDVTIFDKRNHHIFQPLLYQVATAMLSPAQIAYPIRSMFKNYKNVRVILANITEIDKEKKTVKPKRSNQQFSYDYLIVASGARHSYFGHPEWEKYAWGLKTTRDALKIRERMLYSFEKAERTRFEDKQARFSTFVIVGAGPTGVEMAGAIAELTRKTLRNDFSNFDPKSARIILVEGSGRVLNRYHEPMSEQAKKDLEAMGVEVMLNAMVSNITKEGVTIGDTLIESENIIWAAGNTASPLIKLTTSEVNRMGQAIVSPDFSIKEDDSIFCVGDCAYLEDSNGTLVPAVAQGAIQAGSFVADQLIRENKNLDRQKFAYKNKGSMATIGKSRAVAQVGKFQFSGFFAWLLWSIVHVMFLVDFRNRLLVFFDWFASYFTHMRAVRLINTYRERD
ncbi:NAD(P)/FAD-dependent oxidoreductase [bacterium]|jgi:NADH:ubiquinone reductase (H+-translocating)|nr:NAD(P)/FAD-dependent oxidoreductase [bacterium]